MMGKLNKAKKAMLESSVYSFQVNTKLISTLLQYFIIGSFKGCASRLCVMTPAAKAL